jgi:DNA-directed RNA polymerase sigma subunit (sigma70/sigma32)
MTPFPADVIDANPPLNADEEARLIEAARGGDDEAARRLILSNLRLIRDTVTPYACAAYSVEDLVNEGVLLSYDVIRDCSPNARFGTCLARRLRSRIGELVGSSRDLIRIPASTRRRWKRNR